MSWGGFNTGDKVRYTGTDGGKYAPPFGTVGEVLPSALNNAFSIKVQWPKGTGYFSDSTSFAVVRYLEHVEQSDNLIAPTFEELTGFKEE